MKSRTTWTELLFCLVEGVVLVTGNMGFLQSGCWLWKLALLICNLGKHKIAFFVWANSLPECH